MFELPHDFYVELESRRGVPQKEMSAAEFWGSHAPRLRPDAREQGSHIPYLEKAKVKALLDRRRTGTTI